MPIGITYNNPFDVSIPIAGIGMGGGTIVGASGQSGFAAFPDMQTGYAAGVQRLNTYITGNYSGGTPLNTISALNTSYATDPNWANGVSQYSGIPVNQTLDPNNAQQMAQLQYGVLAQELGPSNATNVFNSYGPNANPQSSIFDTGGSGSGFSYGDIGGLGTTNPSGYPSVATSQYGSTGFTTSDPLGTSGLEASNPLTFGGDINTGGTTSAFNPSPNTDTSGSTFDASSGLGSQAGTGGSGIDTSGLGSGGAGDTSGGGFLGGGGASGAGSGTLGGGLLGSIPGIGTLLGGGGGSGTSGQVFFQWLGDWAIRGAIIILGFIFVIAGLYMLKGNTLKLDAGGALKAAKAIA